jgi:urea transporter
MKQPVDMIFPPVEPGEVPYWRLALRGCSQFCFQTNELTGLFFLAAVFVASPIASVYLLVAAFIVPAGSMIMRDRDNAEETGLPGLNPSLMAVSLPAFYQTSWTDFGMWGVLLVCVVCTVILVKLFVAVLPIPIFILPFLIIFWLVAAVAPHTDILQPITFPDLGVAHFNPLLAVLMSLGQAVYSPMVLSGILFIAGLLVSNWRHAVVALLGAIIGTLVSYYYGDVDPESVNLGLYGFNGVLAAVAAYVTCGARLRLSVLGAILATMMIPAVKDLGLQTLAAPFLFSIWFMLALGWFDDKWFGARAEQEPGRGGP